MNLRKVGCYTGLLLAAMAVPAYALDPEALSKQQYPADGTFDQADLCAASMSIMYVAMSRTDLSGNPNAAQFRDNLPLIITVFSREAARLKGTTQDDYVAHVLPHSMETLTAVHDPKFPAAMIKYCFPAFKTITMRPAASQAPAPSAPVTSAPGTLAPTTPTPGGTTPAPSNSAGIS